MADDDIADHLDAAVRQGDRQRLLMIEQRLRARRHWDAQEGRDVGEEVDDIAWLLARCRLLEAERDKAREALKEIAEEHSRESWDRTNDWVCANCRGYVPCREARIAAKGLGRGVSVPETP